MSVLVDRPAWPAHGRLWAHVVSDASLAELHAFARRAGLPPRSFEGDHYDVPAERWHEVVRAGARPVEGRELVRALQASGLRLPKRRGERVLASWPLDDPARAALVAAGLPVPPHVRDGDGAVDCVASPLGPPTRQGTALVVADGVRVHVVAGGLPDGAGGADGAVGAGGTAVGYLRLRLPDERLHLAAVRGPDHAAAPTFPGGPPVELVDVTAADGLPPLRLWVPLLRLVLGLPAE
ncbi:DUF4031 domain-containing protein [Angustibacter aerolatus]